MYSVVFFAAPSRYIDGLLALSQRVYYRDLCVQREFWFGETRGRVCGDGWMD